MRDLKGFKSTRHSLLMMNPERRASWLGYVLALHLLGEYDEAVKVLTTYEKTHTDVSVNIDRVCIANSQARCCFIFKNQMREFLSNELI